LLEFCTCEQDLKLIKLGLNFLAECISDQTDKYTAGYHRIC